MKYEINNIINESDLKIKQIVYSEVDIAQLDFKILSKGEKLKFDQFFSKNRKLEFYFSRLLLKDFNLDHLIEYKETGKPFLTEGFISLSHSKNVILIAYSKKYEVGIDIEFYKEKIHRIKHKFLSQFELKNWNCENIEILTMIWSIKEAIYKIEDIPGLRFREDMSVQSIDNPGYIAVYKNGESHNYEFNYLKYKEFIITYCHLISM